jgi:hypothetical protein
MNEESVPLEFSSHALRAQHRIAKVLPPKVDVSKIDPALLWTPKKVP